MNSLRLLCALSVVLLLTAGQVSEDQVKLLSHTRRSGRTYEWWLGVSRAAKLPIWRPEKHAIPPLALEKAIEIARKSGDSGEKLESVAILSVAGAEYAPPFDAVFYYQVKFKGVMAYDTRPCIVLLDGSVLEPIETSIKQKEK